jgi:predicted nucleic acid-binding protein
LNVIVLDASVAVKWFLPSDQESLTTEAFALAQRYQAGEIEFAVPDLFWAEVTNFFWKAIRQGRCRLDTAKSAIAALKIKAFPTVRSLELIEPAFDIALAFQRTVYDSIYIALAVQMNTYLATADERLANAVAAKLPVKWLGAL